MHDKIESMVYSYFQRPYVDNRDAMVDVGDEAVAVDVEQP